MNVKHRRLGLLRRFLGTMLLGCCAAYVVASDIHFSEIAESADARLLSNGVTWRSGVAIADIEFFRRGIRVRTELYGWYRVLPKGATVEVVFDPTDSSRVTLDAFRERHGAAVLALVALAIVAMTETCAFIILRRRQASELKRELRQMEVTSPMLQRNR